MSFYEMIRQQKNKLNGDNMEQSIKTARTIDLIDSLAKVGKAVAAKKADPKSRRETVLVDTAKELLERQKKHKLGYGEELECEKYIDCNSADFVQNLIRRLLEQYMELRSAAENLKLSGDDVDEDLIGEAEDFYYAAYALSFYNTIVDNN